MLKALSLCQPFASLIAVGAKKLETRSWRTHYRGPIAIHASLSKQFLDLCMTEPFKSALEPIGHVVRGSIIAVARLTDCQRTEIVFPSICNSHERAFGDYGPGRWAWKLEKVVRLEEPIAISGRLYLWDLPAEVEEAVSKQVEVTA